LNSTQIHGFLALSQNVLARPTGTSSKSEPDDNPHAILSNYREIVTPEEAERYWQIFPPAPAENVVPMSRAQAS
jgi:hypothetical protein